MKKNGAVPAVSWNSAILLINLLAYSALIIFCCHYDRITGDATLYLSIAEKYIQGDFTNAINGYWGPLLSWLLIPFLALGASHVLAINNLNLIFGLLTIAGVWRLSYRFDTSENVRMIVLLPLVPVMLFISLTQPMDFLFLCVLVFYLNIVFREDYPDRVRSAVLAGCLGAFAYFSKPFGFPFFIAHFLIINVFHYFRGFSREYRMGIMKSALAGFLVFFLLSGIWVALISEKYGRFTFSNMSGGVLASLGPGSQHDTLEKGDPIFFEGFMAPPNETAFVIYEDPSHARNKAWNPLGSRRELKHYLNNLSENVFEGLRIFESFSRLSIAIVIAYFLMVARHPLNKLLSRTDILYPLFTLLLYTGGYAPFHYETRYLWIVNILLLLMGGKVLDELLRSSFMKNNIMKSGVILFFVLSFVITPVKASLDMSRNNINREMHELGAEISRRYDIRGNIASNRKKVLTAPHDSWHNTFRLAYWLRSRYFGQARADISEEELQKEFQRFGIDYYFYWGDPSMAPGFLSHYREITGGDLPGLRIYSLHEVK